MDVLNVNLGLLGHVDSGKTSLARALSQIGSTAAFDKAPQSQQRGITIDLGFSCWRGPLPDRLRSVSQMSTLQLTFVDCPGHASLLKTVLGGVLIIDLIILVIDATKGVQTQTAECMLLAEITKKPVIIAINKIDMISEELGLKMEKKMRATVSKTTFSECPIVKTSALNSDIKSLLDCILNTVYPVERREKATLLIAVDHCFGIQGKGTILTGTILQGKVSVNDEIEIPKLKLIRKIKSMQAFKVTVSQAGPGDRVGMCITQVDPGQIERCLVCYPGSLAPTNNLIIRFHYVRFYNHPISSKSHYHITVGHETVFSAILLFEADSAEPFQLEKPYNYLDVTEKPEEPESKSQWALIQLDHPAYIPIGSLVIGAKLDVDVHTSTCRLAFYGQVEQLIDKSVLSKLKIFKEKLRKGLVDRVVDEFTVVGKNMFSKNSDLSRFLGLKVSLSTGQKGVIDGTFGQSGKFKVRLFDALNSESKTEINKTEIFLRHKKFIFDPNKKLMQ